MPTRRTCEICHKKLKHPVRRGRRARFCGPVCREIYRKDWRKRYDAQEYVKKAKREREMAKYWAEKNGTPV